MDSTAPLLEIRRYFRPKQRWNRERAADATGRGQNEGASDLSKMAPAEGTGYRREGMAASRLELNLVRLLCRCETMAAEKRDPDEWRLEKVRETCTSEYNSTPRRRPTGLTATGPDSPVPTAALATPLPVGSATSTCSSRPLP